MTTQAPTIFVTSARRPRAVPPDVCPQSFPNDMIGIFRRRRAPSFFRPFPKRPYLLLFHTRQKSLNRHSNRMSIRDTASFK